MPQPDLPPIPKMYLAQIEGRCSLQYIAENEDRKTWLKEWVDPKQDGKPYTRENNINGSIHCFEIKFPGRVFSNSGRDSILRPVMGKNGIPYIPGSSVKGLFRRVCNRQQKIDYCGDSDHPGKLRFHGAYPKGDWTKLHRDRKSVV
jgi:CRISPR-associated protein Cmr6